MEEQYKYLKLCGLFGVISFLSYLAAVAFSPLAYPGYDWMTMAVSELSAEGAPSADLANRLNSLFGPCGLLSIMAVCVAIANVPSKRFRVGVYCFAAMEWLCNVGYTCFPWVSAAPNSHPQNVMHLIVTALVVVFSLAALILISFSAKKAGQRTLGIWAVACLAAMLIGPIGTGLFPASVFGLFERFSTFSAVIFNAVLGMYLFMGKFDKI